MLRTSGASSVGVFFVQSPVAATSKSGRGAMRPAISVLNVSTRRFGEFSQRQPPCM